MSYATFSTPLPRWQRLAGSVMSGLVIAFLIFDGAIKLAPIAPVTETLVALGYSGDPSLARGLGIMTLIIVLLYAIPRTSVLGAILLTGLLGGAITTHLRVGSPVFSHLLFGVYLGLLAWGGLYLRSETLRMLTPLRRKS
ncbi:DoxX family protein [Agrobacterium sp. BA1120]|uniref:DoxX family protein n=1 Tax=Agrobacterium sp. BA1120 TaxID=3228927 RepID=UPI00336A64A2